MRWSWIGDERVAVSGVPAPADLRALADDGVTHVVNCRARWQTLWTRDLAAERATFGRDFVAYAPMWDDGRPKHHRLWSGAAEFAVAALGHPGSRVLIHCHAGARRSVLVAYAVLRLRGRIPAEAEALLVRHRPVAVLVPAYARSVEDWLRLRV